MEIIKVEVFDVLTQEVQEELVKTTNLIVTSENESETRKVRTDLNKYRESIDKTRKDINKQIKNNFDSVLKLVDDRILEIDMKLDLVDEVRRNKVRNEIELYYLDQNLNIPLEKLFNEKWLNKTADWKKELDFKIETIKNEMSVLDYISTSQEIKDVYYETLSLAQTKATWEERNATTVKQTITTLKLIDVNEEQLSKVLRTLDMLKITYERTN